MALSTSTTSPLQVQRATPPQLPSDAEALLPLGRLTPEACCASLGSSMAGLTLEAANRQLKIAGLNLVTREIKPTLAQEIWTRAKNPLNALLLTLAVVSYSLGDVRAAIVIAIMVLLAVATSFIQEHRANQAAASLGAMVKTTASVRRRSDGGDGQFAEVREVCSCLRANAR